MREQVCVREHCTEGERVYMYVERCREGDSCENTMKASFTLFRPSTLLVSCPRLYFSGIGSGNIAYIELFQWNSIIDYVNT